MDNDIVIGDTENYSVGDKAEFSYTANVMLAMRKCIDAGAKEMKEGYWNDRLDKFGNAIKTWVPDSRISFIECVKTFETICKRDFDEIATKEINKIKEKMKKRYEELCREEEYDWRTCPPQIIQERVKLQLFYKEGSLHKDLPYYQQYIEDEVSFYRIIFEELCKLIKRLDDYRGEEFKA